MSHGQGKPQIDQGNVREKSGKFVGAHGWTPCRNFFHLRFSLDAVWCPRGSNLWKCCWPLSDHWSVHLTSLHLPGFVWYGGLEIHWSYLRYVDDNSTMFKPVNGAVGPLGRHWVQWVNILRPGKMSTNFPTAILNAFSRMKSFVFQFKLHWSLLRMAQLTISQQWFDKPLPEPMLTQFTDAYMWH